MIRVLLVDDHPLLRAGFRLLVQDCNDIQIVAEAGNFSEAVAALGEGGQDVVVLDIGLPDRSGIEVLSEIQLHWPKVGVVIHTRMPEEQFAVRAMKAGAAAFLNKSTSLEEVANAIRTVAKGGTYVNPRVAATLAQNLRRDRMEMTHDDLSPREYEVFRMIVSGNSTTDIASRLNVSAKTVSTHKKNMMTKLALDSTTDLVKYAVRNGLVSVDDPGH
jgi:two-component system invasion response regulator UvrY